MLHPNGQIAFSASRICEGTTRSDHQTLPEERTNFNYCE